MKLRGNIKDGKIVLDCPVDMDDGLEVEVDIRPVKTVSRTDMQKVLEESRELRNALEKRWGGRRNLSTQDVREGRGPLS